MSSWLTVNNPALATRIVWMKASADPATNENHAGNGLLVLQKPFKAEDLLSAVETALGQPALGGVQPASIQG